MRKQIQLTETNNDVVSRFARHCMISQSAVINYAIYWLCCTFNDTPERTFFKQIIDFYNDYYKKELPRGLKAKGGKMRRRRRKFRRAKTIYLSRGGYRA